MDEARLTRPPGDFGFLTRQRLDALVLDHEAGHGAEQREGRALEVGAVAADRTAFARAFECVVDGKGRCRLGDGSQRKVVRQRVRLRRFKIVISVENVARDCSCVEAVVLRDRTRAAFVAPSICCIRRVRAR